MCRVHMSNSGISFNQVIRCLGRSVSRLRWRYDLGHIYCPAIPLPITKYPFPLYNFKNPVAVARLVGFPLDERMSTGFIPTCSFQILKENCPTSKWEVWALIGIMMHHLFWTVWVLVSNSSRRLKICDGRLARLVGEKSNRTMVTTEKLFLSRKPLVECEKHGL